MDFPVLLLQEKREGDANMTRRKPVGYITSKKRHTRGPKKGQRKRAPIMGPSGGRQRTPFKIKAQRIKQKPKPTERKASGVASYNKATGWMRVVFDEKPSREVLDGLKREGFRYKPRSRAWSAKWTPERENHARKLVNDWQVVDIKPNWQKKAEVAEAQALKHHKESDERYDQFRKELRTIPMGQPILVGHHSEKSHRAHLKRLDRQMKKSIEEKEIAKKYGERAKRYRRKAVGEPAGLIYRRIQKLEAEERGWQRSLKRLKENREFAKAKPKLAEKYGIKADPQEEERAKRYITHTQERLKIEREKYNASGSIVADKLQLKKGDLVRTQIGVARVVRVNPKTVTVSKEVSGSPWKLKLDKSKIYGKVE